eukprot:Sspe_Gene.62872::Locus_35597_Transcript_2_2_Confidence_0.333_Length_425::g.62872::m.62872
MPRLSTLETLAKPTLGGQASAAVSAATRTEVAGTHASPLPVLDALLSPVLGKEATSRTAAATAAEVQTRSALSDLLSQQQSLVRRVRHEKLAGMPGGSTGAPHANPTNHHHHHHHH